MYGCIVTCYTFRAMNQPYKTGRVQLPSSIPIYDSFDLVVATKGLQTWNVDLPKMRSFLAIFSLIYSNIKDIIFGGNYNSLRVMC